MHHLGVFWPQKLVGSVQVSTQPIFEAKILLNLEDFEKMLNMKVIRLIEAPQNHILFVGFDT